MAKRAMFMCGLDSYGQKVAIRIDTISSVEEVTNGQTKVTTIARSSSSSFFFSIPWEAVMKTIGESYGIDQGIPTAEGLSGPWGTVSWE